MIHQNVHWTEVVPLAFRHRRITLVIAATASDERGTLLTVLARAKKNIDFTIKHEDSGMTFTKINTRTIRREATSKWQALVLKPHHKNETEAEEELKQRLRRHQHGVEHLWVDGVFRVRATWLKDLKPLKNLA